MAKSFLKLALGAFLILCPVIMFFLYAQVAAPEGGPFDVEIPEGTGRAAAGDILEQAGVISSAGAFVISANRRGTVVKPGRYRFATGVYPWTAAKILEKGAPVAPEITVTIPEGLRLEEIAARLEKAGVTSKSELLALASDARFREDLLGYPAPTLEGYLFPETYRFKPRTDAEDVIRRMHATLLENFSGLSRPDLNMHQFLTLASIVEREAQLAEERPRIAGVYLNRLRKGMRLEADPTVRYAIGKWDTSPVLYVDLESPSPYNTYRVSGLPPGPISAVGRASLEAVANPLATDELFFVARGDGGHLFATTFARHQANIAAVRGTRR